MGGGCFEALVESLQLVATLSRCGMFDREGYAALLLGCLEKASAEEDKLSRCSKTRYDKAVRKLITVLPT